MQEEPRDRPMLDWAQVQLQKADDILEAELGFALFTDGEDRLGWLMNMNTVRALCADEARLAALAAACCHNIACTAVQQLRYSCMLQPTGPQP